MGTNTKIAAAVALALGGVSAAQAVTTPTLAQCRSPNDTLFVAGSSAAQNAFGAALNTDAFGSSEVTYSASNGNFKAYCGISANASFAPTGDVVVVHYRAEGGSVVGALPLSAQKTIKFLDLTNTTGVTGTSITTTGTSGTVGTTDGWGGPLTEHLVEVGITDVEPGQFVNKNYPSAYSSSVFGKANYSQLSGLNRTAIFDQVFGLFVNTGNINGGATGQAVNLSRSSAANILAGVYTDWSQVPTVSGGQVSTVAASITVVNREPGSGTRTGASVYFLNYGCGTNSTPVAETGAGDGYQTADVLTTAESTPGAITYASIDNAGKANLTTVSLSGVAPTNLAATSGDYDWWEEAMLIKGPVITSPGGTTIFGFLQGELSNVNTAPHVVDILAIPGGFSSNTPTVPVTANNHVSGATIYVNPFTRGGNASNSCNYPAAP